MARLIFSPLLFMLLNAGLQAQSFPTQEASWQGVTFGIAGPIPYRNAVCGDTLINQVTYSKFYEFNENIDGELVRTYKMAVREGGPRVWCVEAGANTETLLYDFSLEAGDQIRLKLIGFTDSVAIKVANVTSISVDGVPTKVLNFVPIAGIEESWIEGIGSSKGPTQRAFTAVDGNSQLQCFRQAGELIYRTVPQGECSFVYECDMVSSSGSHFQASADFELYPTASSGQLTFTNASESAVSLELYSLSGRKCASYEALPPGQHEINLEHLSAGMYLFTVREPQKNLYLQRFRIIISE
jgi:hypothetical protein